MEITLPYNFTPRPYQKDFFDRVFSIEDWKPKLMKKRWVIVRPRRHWKDKSIFNMLVIPEMLNRIWLYYYVFPEYSQARKSFWENIDNDWFPLLWHVPENLIKNRNNSEMKLELVNGSILRVVWTDKNIDWVVWSNPVWIVFSEWALCNPTVWDYMKPMLMANWWRAYFVYTPRWHNHWYDLLETAKKFWETWVYDLKTAEETIDNDWNRIFSDTDLKRELEEWMDEDLRLQEYFCSFEASLKWAIYSNQIKDAEADNRFCAVKYEPALPVYTFRDLWISDTMSIWFAQFFWKEIRIIDHYEMSWQWLEHYVEKLNSKWYNYWWHFLPHDWNVRELWTWTTRLETLEKLWLKNIKITPNIWVDLWISKTRALFNQMYFDTEKCKRWIEAIKSYIFEYDDKNKIRSRTPKHNRASHSADALRYLAVNYDELTKISRPQKIITTDYKRFL